MKVILSSLACKSEEYERDENEALWKLFYDLIDNGLSPFLRDGFGYMLYINRINIHKYWLTDPISSLKVKDEEIVRIYVKLCCRPGLPTEEMYFDRANELFKLTVRYYGEGRIDEAVGVELYLKMTLDWIDEIKKLYYLVDPKETINTIDPISLEELTIDYRTCFWSQNGKTYGVEYDNMMEYIEKCGKEDEDGVLQIPNPFTGQDIPDPWRYDFVKYHIEFIVKRIRREGKDNDRT